jgi:hypothetical protein
MLINFEAGFRPPEQDPFDADAYQQYPGRGVEVVPTGGFERC